MFASLGFYAVAWIEHYLLHGPGDVQGRRIELDDELAGFLIKAYALDEDGRRMVRRAFLSRPKGRNKSGFAAMVECFEALGECRFDHWAIEGETAEWGYAYQRGEPVGRRLTYVEILNVATEENQAGHSYDAVYYMLHPDTCSAVLLERFGAIDVGLTRTNLPERRGTIEPVSAANDSRDGAKSSFVVADETHLWCPPVTGVFKLGKMHQTMVRNLLKRKEASGWMLETSTMYVKGEGSVAEGTHNSALNSDSRLLFDHREASDHWDLRRRADRIAALREVYGAASDWMDIPAIADYWAEAQASEAEFRRFFLNQPVKLRPPAPAFDLERWAGLADIDAAAPRHAMVVAHMVDGHAALGVASAASEERTLLMCYTQAGTNWVSGMVADLVAAQDICEVAVSGDARQLRPGLARAGVSFDRGGIGKSLTVPDIKAACMALRLAVADKSIVHVAQPELDAAVQSAEMANDEPRDWAAPLVAVAAAYYRWSMSDTLMPAIY